MRKHIVNIIVVLAAAFTMLSCSSHKSEGPYVLGFYNVENLFDTLDDEGKNDSEFLPDGYNGWTEEVYHKKLHNIATVISSMAEHNGRFHSLLGLAEVENMNVLNDLLAQPELEKSGYKVIHHEGPDARGIDVALLYRSEDFELLESEAIPFDFNTEIEITSYSPEELKTFKTRDILMVRGELAGEMFAIYVAHLPSRRGDKGSDLRARGAEIMYDHATAMMEKYPGIKLVVMGDMNDDPGDISMVEYLHAKETWEETSQTDFFSPFMSMLKAGYGSMEYRGVWQIFDQILVNKALIGEADGTLKIQLSEGDKYYGSIYKPDFLIQQSGRYKGTPFRSLSGGKFIDGYSDHLPTYIIVNK